jgi:4-amino-4-deoxy-L-arabinose transferase-like glycosyltransferase
MSTPPPDSPGVSDARVGLHARFGPVAALLVAAALRFYQLGDRPIWTDEGMAWTGATMPITELLHRCVHRDASPPLFYVLTSAMLRLGDDEWHLRLLPVLASLVLVWLTYRLARLGLGRGPSTFAAFLTALSPFQLQYAQECRTYVVVAMFMVGAMVVYARVQQKPGPQRWLPLVLLTAAGLWTQPIAALGMGSMAVVALLTPTGRRRFWPWAGAMGVAVLLYLPWAIYSSKMAAHLGESHWYIPAPDAHGVFKVLRSALVSPFPLVTPPSGSVHPGLGHYMPQGVAHVLLALPPLLLLFLTVPQMAARNARGFLSRLCWAGWLAPVVAVYIVSLKQSLLLPRYFVFVGPYLSILFTIGLNSVRPALGRIVLAGWMIALTFLGLMRYTHDFTKEPWDQVVAHIRQVAPPGNTAVLVPFDVDPLPYYLRDRRSGIQPFEVMHPDEPFGAHYSPKELDEVDATTRRVSRGFDEVWVIIRSANNRDRWELARRTLVVAGEGRRLAERRMWTSYNAPLYVSRFVRADSASVARP